MVQYDAQVIQEFADSLYSRADAIIAGYAVVGGVLGLLAGAVMGGGAMLIIVGAVGGAIGYATGVQKAFLLKLQAQQALCQAQIERNTSMRTAGAVAAE